MNVTNISNISNFFQVSIRPWMGIAVLTIALWGCSAPEDENAGYCRLSCSETSLAASNYKIAPRIVPDDFACTAAEVDEAVSGNIKWLITAPIDRIGGGSSAEVERSAIGFNVSFGGSPKFTDTTPAVNTDEPGHLGVITPQSEWCSDSCGLATVAVTGTCSADKDIDYSISLNSGAAVSEAVTWTSKKPE
jgi:hypothetical protein